MNQSELQRARQLSNQLKTFGMKPKSVIQKPVKPKTLDFLRPRSAYKKPVLKPRPSPFKFDLEALKVKNGKDGKDALPPSEGMLRAIIEPLVKQIHEETKEPLEITSELVKKIVQIMHSLPENDKLEVSKGIRNHQAFIYKGTKYGMEEMMHGGSNATGGAVMYYTPTGTVNGLNASFGVTARPTSVISDGIQYFEDAGYSYAALIITMDIPPSSYIRYTL